MAKTSTLDSVRWAEKQVIQAASITILNSQEGPEVLVERNPNEDQQNMRNRKKEKEEQLKILIDLASELNVRALKTKRNTEYEILLKCSEIISDYASELVKEILQ